MPKDLAGLSDALRLIAGLDPLTKRNLAVDPPAAAETFVHIGISATNLDGPVRSWINNSFRIPRRKPVLIQGAIKPSMTWADFLKLV
jgi:hypothetical protein